jgi:hypothetical protein
MWRPFANNFVPHTYGDFRRKHDKIWTNKPLSAKKKSEKISLSDISPYMLVMEELEHRNNEFVMLKAKVNEQRKKIKLFDQVFSNKQKEKIRTQKQKFTSERIDKRKSIQRIRSMGSNKVYRFRSTSLGENGTFALTSVEKTTSGSKAYLFQVN